MTILFLTFLIYLLIHLKIFNEYDELKYYIPGIVWICLITYFILPHKTLFNYEGRMYVLNIIIKCI